MFFTKKYKEELKNLHESVHTNFNNIVDVNDSIETLESKISSLKEQLDELTRENEIRKLKRSSEPWASVEMGEPNETGQVRVEMDWNSAFIQMLTRAGYTGVSEEEIFQKYLLTISSEYFDRDITGNFKE